MALIDLVRPNVRRLKPYATARHEFTGKASVYLDANENALGSVTEQHYNRYPDPNQTEVKQRLAQQKDIGPEYIFLGNGSDEAIDVLMRVFGTPGTDNVIIPEPSYGMYRVCADVNDLEVRTFLLDENFDVDPALVLDKADDKSKIIILCSPNNPSANLMKPEAVLELLQKFAGVVVVDEAYIDFCPDKSLLPWVKEYENLVILQTFSKAWGMAGLRLGMAFGDPMISGFMNKVKYPYNVNEATQRQALQALANRGRMQKMVDDILSERVKLEQRLPYMPMVEKVFPSAANFLLVRFKQSKKVFETLRHTGVIVRDRSSLPRCKNCLRITVGSPAENDVLLSELEKMGS